MNEKWYVDERVGCVAVRIKSTVTDYCLGADTPGVVQFFPGTYDDEAKIWRLDPAVVAEAHEIADRHNAMIEQPFKRVV